MTAHVARQRFAFRLPRVDVRLVIGLVLIAVSIVGGLRLSSNEDTSVSVYRAATDLSVGHVVTRADFEPTRVSAVPSVIDALLTTSAGPPIGRVIREPLRNGALVSADSLGAAAPRGRRVTVPVSADHALGGAIRAGDRVDVLATFAKGTETARTITVAVSAQVIEVVRSDGLFGQDEGALGAVTLRVAADEAVVVVFASRNAEIDIIEDVEGQEARSSFDMVELP